MPYNVLTEEGYVPLDYNNISGSAPGGGEPLLALEGNLCIPGTLFPNSPGAPSGVMGRPVGVGPGAGDGSTQPCIIQGSPAQAFGAGVPADNNIARAMFRTADVPAGTTFGFQILRKSASTGSTNNVSGGTIIPATVNAIDPNIVNVDLTITGTHGTDGDTDSYAVYLTETGGQQRRSFVGYFVVETSGL